MSDTGNTDLLFGTWKEGWREIQETDNARAAAKNADRKSKFKNNFGTENQNANIKTKELACERLKFYLHYNLETGVFTNLRDRSRMAKAGQIAGTAHKDGYVTIKINCVSHLAHRLVWLYIYGKFPLRLLDHINGIRNDNRLANLREATDEQNLQNQKVGRGKYSKYLGVSFNLRQKKWVAYISIGQKIKHLGYFLTEDDAYAAYLAEKRTSHSHNTL